MGAACRRDAGCASGRWRLCSKRGVEPRPANSLQRSWAAAKGDRQSVCAQTRPVTSQADWDCIRAGCGRIETQVARLLPARRAQGPRGEADPACTPWPVGQPTEEAHQRVEREPSLLTGAREGGLQGCSSVVPTGEDRAGRRRQVEAAGMLRLCGCAAATQGRAVCSRALVMCKMSRHRLCRAYIYNMAEPPSSSARG